MDKKSKYKNLTIIFGVGFLIALSKISNQEKLETVPEWLRLFVLVGGAVAVAVNFYRWRKSPPPMSN